MRLADRNTRFLTMFSCNFYRCGAVVFLSLASVILCNGDNCSKSEITLKCTNESLAEGRDYSQESSDLVWSHFLEDYVLSQSGSNRQSKDITFLNEMSPQMQMMAPHQSPINYHSSAYKRPAVYITKRIGEAVELEPHMRPPIKVGNPQFRPMTNLVQHQQPQPQPQQQPGFLQQLFGIGGGGGNPTGPSGQASSLQQQQQHQQQQQQQQQQQLRPIQQSQQHTLPPHAAPPQTFRAVSENDLYLLGAIEKLVYRVDYLESRIRRAEQLIYYLMAGNNQKEVRDPCPSNFTRISDNCYYINSNQKVNWKTANSACKALNSHLVEFERNSENEEIMAYLLNQPNHRGRDYWLGALNPGLLWIWSNSAKPVNPNMNLTSIAMSHDNTSNAPAVETNLTEDSEASGDNGEKKKDEAANETILNNTLEIKGQGRCLRLTYNPTKHSYLYYGQECTSRHHYICEFEDKTLDNKIKKITRELKLFD